MCFALMSTCPLDHTCFPTQERGNEKSVPCFVRGGARVRVEDARALTQSGELLWALPQPGDCGKSAWAALPCQVLQWVACLDKCAVCMGQLPSAQVSLVLQMQELSSTAEGNRELEAGLSTPSFGSHITSCFVGFWFPTVSPSKDVRAMSSHVF